MPKIVPSRTRHPRLYLLASISALLVLGTGAAGANAAADPVSLSFADGDLWTVPADVTSIVVELTGGDGGTATSSLGRSSIGSGGRGGHTSATIAVSEGDVLAFRVATAGSGVDIATAPLTDVAGGTGAGEGGESWASGGGSSSAEINGSLVAGAPGGGGGSAVFSTQQGMLFTSDGGDGGSDGEPISDAGQVLAGGALAGGNGVEAGGSGFRSTFALNGIRFIAVVSGGGGAGWPGGTGGTYMNDGAAGLAYGGGGAGGGHFASPDATNVVFDVKAVDEPAAGSARVTYVVSESLPTDGSSLAPTGTGSATASLIGAAAIALLGIGLWISRSQSVTRRRRSS